MKHWTMFWILGLVWGSSFLLIKVAVDEFGALALVSVRIGLAALFMAAFLRLTGRGWPTQRRERAALLYVGVMNTAVPFTLITWGEQDIDSGLATVLNATVPLFTLFIAHFALADERITLPKVLGLLLGFAGVALLASRDADSSSPNPLSGQLAILVASACYASSAVTIRRFLRGVDPLAVAGYSLMIGAVAIISLTLLAALTGVESLPTAADLDAGAVAAVVTLALLNTVVAYFLFYGLIATWGATRTTLVTYAMPPIGLTLGAVFLDETIDWKIIVGAVMILGGIVVVNWRRQRRALQTTPPAPESAV